MSKGLSETAFFFFFSNLLEFKKYIVKDVRKYVQLGEFQMEDWYLIRFEDENRTKLHKAQSIQMF